MIEWLGRLAPVTATDLRDPAFLKYLKIQFPHGPVPPRDEDFPSLRNTSSELERFVADCSSSQSRTVVARMEG